MGCLSPPTPSIYYLRIMNLLKPLFELGETFATSGVTAWAERHEIDLTHYLRRHHCGSWGDLDAEDQAANESALADGTRIFSAYIIGDRKVYCVTEYDRSITTIMLSSEY